MNARVKAGLACAALAAAAVAVVDVAHAQAKEQFFPVLVYRTGPYAPQSLLGLASSLAAIGANDEACSTLSSLNSQFPTPPAGLQPRIDAVSKKASCQ